MAEKTNMLTKIEIIKLLQKINMSSDVMQNVETILRNYDGDNSVPVEKFEAICKLIINK